MKAVMKKGYPEDTEEEHREHRGECKARRRVSVRTAMLAAHRRDGMFPA